MLAESCLQASLWQLCELCAVAKQESFVLALICQTAVRWSHVDQTATRLDSGDPET